MAKSNKELVEEFHTFIPFVEALGVLDETHWNMPIAPGKWTVKDVIAHIMLWDKYFYEEAVHQVVANRPVTVKHIDFNEFNQKAIAYAATKTKKEILKEFVDYRTKIIYAISDLDEELYIKAYKDGDKNKFSIRGYLRDFISHDKHHKKQIEQFLKS